MKRNRVETTILEFWFSRHMWVIQKLYVDDIVILIVHSGATLRIKLLFFIKNILGGQFGYIEAIALKPHVGLLFSYLANSKYFFLFFLIEQDGGIVIHDFINIYTVVVSHPLVVGNRRLYRGHWWVPRCILISKGSSAPYLVIIVRIRSWRKVYPYVACRGHSW